MRSASVLTLLVLLSTPSQAATYPTPAEHDFLVRDFHFASGETLPEVRIHYVTIGTPARDEKGAVRNAVLILHGTGGSSQQFLNDHFAGVLFAPGGLLDASRYFLVIPDNVGHGHSSKPSDGLHARFPHYAYDDMVDLQHRLLVDGLSVSHLFLVVGTSMGGMQTWMWGERYPAMMDALIPLACAPTQIAGRNRIWRKMMIDDIRTDPEWLGGEYKKQPRGLAAAVQILLIVGSAPLQWQKAAPTRDAADLWVENQMKARLATNDANDLLYALEASRDYDPSSQLERITAPLLAINSADDFINPPELGFVEGLMKRVGHGRFVLLPITPETRGHGTHTWPALWQQYVRDFLAPLSSR
jgi:homoserine O-acetyltransferase/O-succinyltransferase